MEFKKRTGSPNGEKYGMQSVSRTFSDFANTSRSLFQPEGLKRWNKKRKLAHFMVLISLILIVIGFIMTICSASDVVGAGTLFLEQRKDYIIVGPILLGIGTVTLITGISMNYIFRRKMYMTMQPECKNEIISEFETDETTHCDVHILKDANGNIIQNAVETIRLEFIPEKANVEKEARRDNWRGSTDSSEKENTNPAVLEVTSTSDHSNIEGLSCIEGTREDLHTCQPHIKPDGQEQPSQSSFLSIGSRDIQESHASSFLSVGSGGIHKGQSSKSFLSLDDGHIHKVQDSQSFLSLDGGDIHRGKDSRSYISLDDGCIHKGEDSRSYFSLDGGDMDRHASKSSYWSLDTEESHQEIPLSKSNAKTCLLPYKNSNLRWSHRNGLENEAKYDVIETQSESCIPTFDKNHIDVTKSKSDANIETVILENNIIQDFIDDVTNKNGNSNQCLKYPDVSAALPPAHQLVGSGEHRNEALAKDWSNVSMDTINFLSTECVFSNEMGDCQKCKLHK
ncbi:unnamed protein product [Owenia fusiformis]|uniref:Uncharacterized protein n=1 Tax=Owenia fusiformis TaxID=6347 RepID=A0A8S4PQ37_OWEFU|nr:unnamed protein product [Owenia fusiformis]